MNLSIVFLSLSSIQNSPSFTFGPNSINRNIDFNNNKIDNSFNSFLHIYSDRSITKLSKSEFRYFLNSAIFVHSFDNSVTRRDEVLLQDSIYLTTQYDYVGIYGCTFIQSNTQTNPGGALYYCNPNGNIEVYMSGFFYCFSSQEASAIYFAGKENAADGSQYANAGMFEYNCFNRCYGRGLGTVVASSCHQCMFNTNMNIFSKPITDSDVGNSTTYFDVDELVII